MIMNFSNSQMADEKKPCNPQLMFGKHKGQKLSDIPEDYLRWMAYKKKDQGTIRYGGIIWETVAEHELQRRLGSRPFVSEATVYGARTILPVETLGDEESTTGILPLTATTTVLTMDLTPSHVAWRKDVYPRLTIEAIDGVLMSLKQVKYFLMRSDKSQTFSIWLLKEAQEALSYGEGPASRPGETWTKCRVNYAGACWSFSLLEGGFACLDGYEQFGPNVP